MYWRSNLYSQFLSSCLLAATKCLLQDVFCDIKASVIDVVWWILAGRLILRLSGVGCCSAWWLLTSVGCGCRVSSVAWRGCCRLVSDVGCAARGELIDAILSGNVAVATLNPMNDNILYLYCTSFCFYLQSNGITQTCQRCFKIKNFFKLIKLLQLTVVGVNSDFPVGLFYN